MLTSHSDLERSVDGEAIKTFVRVRPAPAGEMRATQQLLLLRGNTVVVNSSTSFSFDFVGGEQTTQQQVFEDVGLPLCNHALEGYNATLFCYGQTGSGKTFTMQGPPEGTKDSNQRGLMQRTFEYIFEKQREMQAHDPSIKFLNKVSSYVEIYNEQIHDLLDPATPTCILREDLKRGGTFVQGATEHIMEDSRDAEKILEMGTRNRTTAETEMVDLAGSERQKMASTTGDRLREGSHINKSLMTLGSCINALVDISNGRARHVHFRDSKLTQLLKDSLGGNARSTLVATITTNNLSISETISTLRFASRAKLVKTRATINQLMEAADVSQLQNEIKRLQEVVHVLEAERGAGAGNVHMLPIIRQSGRLDKDLLESLKSRIIHLENQKSRSDAVIDKWKLSDTCKDRQLSREKMVSKLRDSEVERLKKTCAGTPLGDSAIQEMQKQLDDAKRLLSKPDTVSVSVAVQLKTLETRLEDLEVPFPSDLARLQTEWIDRLEEFEKEREAFEHHISALESGEAYKTLLETVSKQKEEIRMLEERIESSLDMRISLDADNQEYQEQIELLNSSLKARDLDISRILAEKKALETELASRQTDESKVPGLTQLLDTANEEIVELKGLLNQALLNAGDASRGEKKARRESDLVDRQRSILREKVSDLESERETLSIESDRQQEQIARLEGLCSHKDAELKSVSDKVWDLQHQCKSLESSREDLVVANEELTIQVETFEQSASVLEDRIKQLTDTISCLNQDKTYVEKSLESALKSSAVQESHSVRVLEDELSALKENTAIRESRQEKLIADQAVHTKELMDALTESRNQVVDLDSRLSCLNDVLDESTALKASLEEIERSLSETSTAYDQISTQYNQSKFLCDQMTQAAQERDAEISAAKSVISELEEERDDLLGKVDKAVHQIAALKKASVQKPCVSTAVATDSCNQSAYDEVLRKLNDLDLEHDMLKAKLKETERELKKVSEENRNLLQSNHKQKLQYMVTLKEDFNKVMNENAALTARISKLESLRSVRQNL
ncbi:MAG: hypothetical protein SGCHY_001484 [Lobulomycetales sp.]